MAQASSFSWTAFQSHIRRLSAQDQHKVKEAFELSMRVHDGQARKSGEPYFSHPFAAAQILADMHADAETLIAALLHDALEDTDLSKDEIEKRFGAPVCLMVDALTKLNAEEFAERPTLDEQIESLRKIFTFMQEDVRIMVVKLADRLHNMRTAEHLPEERQKSLAEETRDVYVKIADRLSMQDMRDQLEELCWKALNSALLAEMLRLRRENEMRARTIVPSAQNALDTTGATAQFEQCRFRKLKAQLDAGGGKVTGLTSLTIACVCDTVAVCYQTLGVLHQNWQREAMSFEDFINAPMVNGYRGLHTTIILDDGTRVRCKIRTREMQEYARKGITTRCFTGGETGLSSYVAWGKHISPLSIDTSDRSREFWDSLQSDILGESIIAYCADGRSIQLPRGATALDAALYFLGEQAFRVKSVIVNGKPSALHAPIEHTATVAFEFARKRTIEHQWISWVKTGLALAKIREGLSQESRERKIERGKQLLEQVMVEKHEGLLEEFSPEELLEEIRVLGFSSLDDALVDVAEGRLTASALHKSLFPFAPNRLLHRRRKSGAAMFVFVSDDSRMFGDIFRVCRIYGAERDGFVTFQQKTDEPRVMVRSVFLLSDENLRAFTMALQEAGATDVRIALRSTTEEYFLLGLIIILWALHPVLAKWFIIQGMPPLTLITIRLLTFFVLSSLFYLSWRVKHRHRFVPVKGLGRIIVIPAVGAVGMSFFHYLALAYVAPSVHLVILRLSLILLPLVALIPRKSIKKSSLVDIFFLCTAVSMLLLFSTSVTPLVGVVFSFLTLASYVFYSWAREWLFEQRSIIVRYPIFLFQVGLVLGAIGLALLPWQRAMLLGNVMVFPAVIAITLCVFLPQVMYTALINRRSSSYFRSFLLLEVPVAMLFEFFLLGVRLSMFLSIFVGIVVIGLFLREWQRRAG